MAGSHATNSNANNQARVAGLVMEKCLVKCNDNGSAQV